MVGVLGLELGTQPPGLTGGAAQPPFGALGPAGGPGQRQQALGGALRLRVREPLAVVVVGELGELIHGGSSPFPAVAGWLRWPLLSRPGRAVTIRSRAQGAHRRGTGLRWSVR